MAPKIAWPGGKTFALTIFDDPDSQTLEAGREVYSLLADLGFRTTKGIWPIRGESTPSDHGGTCADPEYRAWAQDLAHAGFEIGFHNATSHTCAREEILRGLDEFAGLFGCYPKTMAQHYFCDEGIYWGDQRVTGLNRLTYNILTRWKNHNKFHGDTEGHPLYWADICHERIRYVRNFVFGDINTLKACPYMPYHDPDRPAVNYWYASSEGANVRRFVTCLREANQERLEADGGACIMYTHFGHGYYRDGALHARFRELMTRLSKRNGWFVPVSTLLDYLLSLKADARITRIQRRQLERRWLMEKIRSGTS